MFIIKKKLGAWLITQIMGHSKPQREGEMHPPGLPGLHPLMSQVPLLNSERV